MSKLLCTYFSGTIGTNNEYKLLFSRNGLNYLIISGKLNIKVPHITVLPVIFNLF